MTGGSPKHSYNARSFVRVALLLIEQSNPGAFSGVRISEINEWCPDQNKYAEAVLPASAKGADVLRRFGMSPLMFHCWCCLLGSCREEDLSKVVKAHSSLELWEPILCWESGFRSYPPMAKGIVESAGDALEASRPAARPAGEE